MKNARPPTKTYALIHFVVSVLSKNHHTVTKPPIITHKKATVSSVAFLSSKCCLLVGIIKILSGLVC